MITLLKNGKIYDPAHNKDGVVEDIYIYQGRIVPKPLDQAKVTQTYDLTGKVVMAGAIDMHSHIGGGKVNIARMMLPEYQQKQMQEIKNLSEPEAHICTPYCSHHATPTATDTGFRYIEMGYTAAFEPAISPINARQAHLEMGDTPMIDKGGYAMLGNDDYFLRMLAAKKDQKAINDYVAWILHATQAIGIKVVNPGGISAFKFNQRRLNLDENHQHYQVSPREVLQSLSRAVHELGIAKPLHVHCNNLGAAGNFETTLNTMGASNGLPMHLTHIQFHSYGTEGDKKFSSAAAQIAEALNKNKNITADVGQILFNQTVTASGDSMMQHLNAKHANPKKSVIMDIECDAGCGVLPFKYRDQNYVNALQWAIGLEIFLSVEDPWRIFLTTDHPNGAPFTSYPHLIRLLMDKTFRNEAFAKLNLDAQSMSNLTSLNREYSLYEIAIMTRAGASKLIGLNDRGHLGVGANADITVYTDQENREAMFAKPDYVFKNGELVVKNGTIVKVVWGATHTAKPAFDIGVEKDLKDYFDRYQTIGLDNFKISDAEIFDDGRGSVVVNKN
ncbi:MAG: formylmethanofuran dehydrogenase subunit A [Methylotenera sp.]|jgi:formylmethanofuran dehydrogenase subunit A|uniref:formylmethanofuran dehydrogenase subunit A n=1 Tax=Methylotenera TaxID=359407 RepID=UPI00037053AC|nr:MULTISPECIES: formylmethanofuran dehydrogenase subunit A [Methylotenera]MDP3211859.1 formylmethanofuran dehydrogenase subunit A [Methylotenera sp.]MDP3776569.1 formylmethanofuran dehydrogenase subunit A [Methylotenera sp.]PPC96239.1 MAG: formylmethanofuran dehydrogenase subunit A [Methylotenera sp.]PPD02047.1 MAG: formylmethanofuran dehydrogenase subunit A [Methylotenera sp.]PPD44380.1 MAG: formylmethanofuran dehydrogenase subunit A [Methylotenera sp.]